MGTDDLGRDVLSGFLHGARISLLVGIITAGGSTILGVVVGALSGFSAGRLDELLMRITEMFLVIPRFFLALILVAILGPSIWNVILAIAILAWPGTSRLVRAEFLSLRETAFVEAARSLGDTRFDLIFREMLPNALPPVIINSTLQIGYAIILEAGLSFLGLGDPSVMSWGYMLNNAQHFLGYSWHMAFFPGLGIFLTVLGLNLLGDGLNDALNPRLKGR